MYITLDPSPQDYIEMINKTFADGLDKIQCFKRWSKHSDLAPYAQALMEWDDMIGGPWEEPESKNLVLESWIQDDPISKDAKKKVN